MTTRCRYRAIFGKGRGDIFDWGAYQYFATSQDLNAPFGNVDKNVYQYLATKSQKWVSRYCDIARYWYTFFSIFSGRALRTCNVTTSWYAPQSKHISSAFPVWVHRGKEQLNWIKCKYYLDNLCLYPTQIMCVGILCLLMLTRDVYHQTPKSLHL